jgi:hypothetical protein
MPLGSAVWLFAKRSLSPQNRLAFALKFANVGRIKTGLIT